MKKIICIIMATMMVFSSTIVFAQEQDMNNIYLLELAAIDDMYGFTYSFDAENFILAEDSNTHKFLRSLDLNNLTVEHYDGRYVDMWLYEQILDKLTAGNFDDVIILILTYNLALIEVTQYNNPRARFQEYSFEFQRMSGHPVRSVCGQWNLVGTVITRGAVTHHANGTWTGSGRPSVTPEFIKSGWSLSFSSISAGYVLTNGGRTISVDWSFNMTASLWSHNLPMLNVNYGRITGTHRI